MVFGERRFGVLVCSAVLTTFGAASASAVDLMRSKNVGCVLICNRGQVIGIFTERDLMRRILAAGRDLTTPLIDCMTAQPVVVDPKDRLWVLDTGSIQFGPTSPGGPKRADQPFLAALARSIDSRISFSASAASPQPVTFTHLPVSRSL